MKHVHFLRPDPSVKPPVPDHPATRPPKPSVAWVCACGKVRWHDEWLDRKQS